MADKDKKLRVILKLPNKSSSSSKAGASASPGVASHKAHASSGAPSKLSAQVVGSNASNRVATPPKKRKFKTLVEGDAKDDHGGVYGAPVSTPPVFKAPLPPLAKKSSHKVLPSAQKLICSKDLLSLLDCSKICLKVQ